MPACTGSRGRTFLGPRRGGGRLRWSVAPSGWTVYCRSRRSRSTLVYVASLSICYGPCLGTPRYEASPTAISTRGTSSFTSTRGPAGRRGQAGGWRSTRSRSTATWRGTVAAAQPGRRRQDRRDARPAELIDPARLVADVVGLDPAGPRRGAWLAVWSMRSGRPTVAGGPASWARTAIWPGRPPGRKR